MDLFCSVLVGIKIVTRGHPYSTYQFFGILDPLPPIRKIYDAIHTYTLAYALALTTPPSVRTYFIDGHLRACNVGSEPYIFLFAEH